MPTYINNTNSPITISEGFKSKTIKPGQSIESEYLLDSFGLTKTDDEPFYNPVIAFDTITETTTITLNSSTNYIQVNLATGTTIKVKFNHEDNIPGLDIKKDILIKRSNKIDKLIISFTSESNNSVDIVQLKESLT